MRFVISSWPLFRQNKKKNHPLRQRIHIGEQASSDVLQSFLSKKHQTKATIETLHHTFLFNKRISIVYQDFMTKKLNTTLKPIICTLVFPFGIS